MPINITGNAFHSIVAAGVRKVMDGREFEKSPSSSAITVFQRGYATTVAQKQSK